MKKQYVIVRSNMAGVFFGILESKNGNEVELSKARKLYRWEGANTVEDLAVKGVSKPENCKFTIVVSQMIISDVCQILPCSPTSVESLSKVKEWSF